ncbi:hypothetical protein, partial [Halodesulfovibrio aestuarii]
YWIKEGAIYAVNGVAKNSSPGIEYAPPSISWNLAEKAIKGEVPATIPVFTLSPEKFIASVNSQLNELGVPALEKETYFSYLLKEKGTVIGAVTMKEVGGELAKAHLEINTKDMAIARSMLSAFFINFVQDETNEERAKIFATVASAKKNPGKEYSITLNRKQFTSILKGVYLNTSVVPAS